MVKLSVKQCEKLVMVYFLCKVNFKKSFYPQTSKADFHVLYILWTETLISAVNEETRLYLFIAYEPFNFNFVILVIQKDVSHHD